MPQIPLSACCFVDHTIVATVSPRVNATRLFRCVFPSMFRTPSSCTLWFGAKDVEGRNTPTVAVCQPNFLLWCAPFDLRPGEGGGSTASLSSLALAAVYLGGACFHPPRCLLPSSTSRHLPPLARASFTTAKTILQTVFFWYVSGVFTLTKLKDGK